MDAELARSLQSPEIIGYASTRSVNAGSSISFFVSSRKNRQYNGQLIRLISPDTGPIGSAAKFLEIDSPLSGTHTGICHKINLGSYLEIPKRIDLGKSFTLTLLVFPTLVDERRQTIVEISSKSGQRVTLINSRVTGLCAEIFSNEISSSKVTLSALTPQKWTELKLQVDLQSSVLRVESSAMDTLSHLSSPQHKVSTTIISAKNFSFESSRVTFAASYDNKNQVHLPTSAFNGKLEDPHLICDKFLDGKPTTAARWDFSLGIDTQEVTDIGPNGINGILRNMPSRGVRGFKWNGTCLSWVNDPRGYAAIHFHDDDLADVNWPVSNFFEVPSDMDSGCYAFRISPIDGETPSWFIPFVVKPPKNTTHSKTVLLLPTTTYGAYANMNLRVIAQFNELAHGRLTVLDSTDLLMLEMPELGKSTYDVHNDGSPVIYSTMNRPVTNFRPNGRMYKFCQDLMILAWLDEMEVDCDVVTDDDVQSEGVDLINRYSVLITGSHPEYVTHKQLDALQKFTDSGGRLMYLGGNGFYSAAEIPEHQDDIVEVRRPGQDNLWRVNHTEGIFNTSGLPAGMWRNIGRPENILVGVGFITQGFDECTFYRRSENSKNPRVSWIFEGLGDAELIGNFGVLQGGAAGYEIDRHDITRGSPTHSVVVASSSGHSPVYDLMVSSILDTLPQSGPSPDPIRADMVFFETENDGAVFSVGSIAWSGSLSHNQFDNNVSRITLNVLNRFLDTTPFIKS